MAIDLAFTFLLLVKMHPRANVVFQLVVFLPALCRKMGVPYCIIMGEGQAGASGPQEALHHCHLHIG